MQIEQGNILISTTVSGEDMFERSVILIAEKNESGYIGFMLNKPFPRKLNELAEFRSYKECKLFAGDPVDTDHLFFIHRRPDWIKGGTKIFDNISLGGNFMQAMLQMNDGMIDEEDVKIFIGYCGWDFQQLADEISEGSWFIGKADESIIFSKNISALWSEYYRQ
ncbi:MAG: YqgE/AlgH family protein [Arachidicoccus sp.]|nr:YqgE/AlgH family protein [Arachidicoccus sp.]